MMLQAENGLYTQSYVQTHHIRTNTNTDTKNICIYANPAGALFVVDNERRRKRLHMLNILYEVNVDV